MSKWPVDPPPPLLPKHTKAFKLQQSIEINRNCCDVRWSQVGVVFRWSMCSMGGLRALKMKWFWGGCMHVTCVGWWSQHWSLSKPWSLLVAWRWGNRGVKRLWSDYSSFSVFHRLSSQQHLSDLAQTLCSLSLSFCCRTPSVGGLSSIQDGSIYLSPKYPSWAHELYNQSVWSECSSSSSSGNWSQSVWHASKTADTDISFVCYRVNHFITSPQIWETALHAHTHTADPQPLVHGVQASTQIECN